MDTNREANSDRGGYGSVAMITSNSGKSADVTSATFLSFIPARFYWLGWLGIFDKFQTGLFSFCSFRFFFI